MIESPEFRACRRSTSEEATAAFYARLRRRTAAAIAFEAMARRGRFIVAEVGK